MRRVRTAVSAAVAAAGLVTGVLTGCASGGASSAPSTSKDLQVIPGQGSVGPFEGVGLVPPRPRPSFTLTDTTGHRYDFRARTSGRTTLVYFGYTHCPDVCPATMADIGVTLRHLPASLDRRVTVVFVSTDVAHDTGPVIARWLKNFSFGTKGATWVGLRGTQGEIDAAQSSSHTFLAEDGGQTHSAQVLVYGPDDYARDSFVYTDSTEQKQMQHDLPLIVGS